MYYDAHTHLNDDKLFPDRQKSLQLFMQSGGAGLICVGTDALMNQRAITIANESEQISDQCIVKATVGIHPGEVSFGNITTYAEVEKRISEVEHLALSYTDLIVAIGECGIDGHYHGFDQHLPLQKYLFEHHCQLAQRLQLPIVVHSRDAFEETCEILTRYADHPIYFHCRGYTVNQMNKAINMFPRLWVGFCWNITYPTAGHLRDALSFFASHTAVYEGRACLVLETDAPWLAPQSRRGTNNTPAYITELYTAVAELLEISLPELCAQLADNRKKLYTLA